MPSPAMLVALVALVVAVGGVAFATIPDSSGTIHGCFQKQSGDLRVVDSASDCRSSEQAISWNQEGRPGPAGANVVARLRGGPLDVHESGDFDLPLSPSSWDQQPNEFQKLEIQVLSDIRCELRYGFLLDGKRLETFRLQFGDNDVSFDAPLFEPGAETAHTLTVKVAPTNVCGEGRIGGVVQSVKAEVLGFR